MPQGIVVGYGVISRTSLISALSYNLSLFTLFVSLFFIEKARNMAGRPIRERKQVKLSDLTEDELIEFMDSVESGEDYSTDDEYDDPTFAPNEISAHEISPEEEECIQECIQNMENSDAFIAEAANFSLNISAIEPPSASSTLNPAEAARIEYVDVPVFEEQAADVPTTSTAVQKPGKRPRSPLPFLETTGPIYVPSTGGFTGESK